MTFKTRLASSSTFLALLAAAALACGGGSAGGSGGQSGGGGTGGGSGPGPQLESLSLGTGQLYASVGAPRQLTVTGHYSDGSTSALTTGLSWTTSQDAVATVDKDGLMTAWAQGSAEITVTHAPSGLSTHAALAARAVTVLRAPAALPAGASVNTGIAYFHVSGLQPGAMYRPSVHDMTDDVDLEVYADETMGPDALLCASDYVGKMTDACVAPASAAGDLWIAVSGEWTQHGASFALDAPAADLIQLAGELPLTALPYAGSVGVAKQFWKVTGLTPGQAYEFRISNLTADVDLEVYGDAYEYRSLCESYLDGTVDDACTASAPAGGALIVELDGQTSLAGGSYTLSVTAK